MSNYPGALDDLATNKTATTIAGAGAAPGDHAKHHNDLAGAVNAVQAELGTTPSGAASTVKDRLDTADGDIATLQAAVAALQQRIIPIVVALPGTALTVGDGQGVFAVPAALNGLAVLSVVAVVSNPSSSGAPAVQLARQRGAARVDVLSTKATVDVAEYSSRTGTAAVVDGTHADLATDDLLIPDVDVAGTGTTGLVVLVTVG